MIAATLLLTSVATLPHISPRVIDRVVAVADALGCALAVLATLAACLLGSGFAGVCALLVVAMVVVFTSDSGEPGPYGRQPEETDAVEPTEVLPPVHCGACAEEVQAGAVAPGDKVRLLGGTAHHTVLAIDFAGQAVLTPHGRSFPLRLLARVGGDTLPMAKPDPVLLSEVAVLRQANRDSEQSRIRANGSRKVLLQQRIARAERSRHRARAERYRAELATLTTGGV